MHEDIIYTDADAEPLTEFAATETPELSRKVRPHRKRSRSKTIAPRRLTKEELRQGALLAGSFGYTIARRPAPSAPAASARARGSRASTTCTST